LTTSADMTTDDNLAASASLQTHTNYIQVTDGVKSTLYLDIPEA